METRRLGEGGAGDYAHSALVRRHKLEEVEGAAGLRLLQDNPILVLYARALLQWASPEVRFCWQYRFGGWVRVRMERSEGDGVLVTLHHSPLPGGLTPRELDVLTLVSGGLS